MNKILNNLGCLAAIIGLLVCLVAGIVRILGNYHFIGMEVSTLLDVGVAMMVAACAFKLYSND